MKVIGIAIALALMILLLFGIGYGVFTGYEFLSVQWGSLNNDWRAILIVTATILVFCTLFASISIQSSIKKYALKGTGKVMAYNEFTRWYSNLKSDQAETLNIDVLKAVTNQMMLWGSKQVARQASILFEFLQSDKVDRKQILQKAEHVYIEIRRDLGLSGASTENMIV